MAIQIEILSLTSQQVSLALYYPATNPIAEAADANRTPAGTRLSVQEQQDLKDGTLIELLKSVKILHKTKAQARARVEAVWEESADLAQFQYQATYRNADLIGKAFNGTVWS